jgi:hypothetical protein
MYGWCAEERKVGRVKTPPSCNTVSIYLCILRVDAPARAVSDPKPLGHLHVITGDRAFYGDSMHQTASSVFLDSSPPASSLSLIPATITEREEKVVRRNLAEEVFHKGAREIETADRSIKEKPGHSSPLTPRGRFAAGVCFNSITKRT